MQCGKNRCKCLQCFTLLIRLLEKALMVRAACAKYIPWNHKFTGRWKAQCLISQGFRLWRSMQQVSLWWTPSLRSLKLLCSCFLSKSVGSNKQKMFHPNGFLIDNKSIKGNWMEQRCREQQALTAVCKLTLQPRYLFMCSPFHQIEFDIK